MKELIHYIWSVRKKLLLGVGALFIVDGAQLVIPLITKKVVDDVAGGIATFKSLLFWAGLVAILAFTIAFFRFFWRYFLLGSAREIERDIRERLFKHLLKLDSSFYDRTRIGDLMAHSTNDLEAVRMATGIGVVASFDFLILFFIALAMMISINPFLTLLAFIPLPFLSVFMLFMGKTIHGLFMKVQEGFSRITEKVQEDLSGVKVIKSFVQEDGESNVFLSLNRDYFHKNMKLAYFWGSFFPLITVVAGISTAIVLYFGGVRVISGQITLGSFVAFTSYLGLLIWPMMAVGWVTNLFQRGAASMDRIMQLLREKPRITDIDSPIKIKELKGKLSFKNLTFYFDGSKEPALKNISVEIHPGEKLGIIGKTGSGKSTLCNLLLRVYDPPHNTVFIDRKDVRKYYLEDLRREILLVPQDPFIFSQSVAENIAFTRPNASLEDIKRAAKWAEIDEEIRKLPKGYETIVGERGVTLSGGQKQRIALARSFLMDPSIFILDDALSAVDSETEEKILLNFKEYLLQKTAIIISYRTSVLKNMDRIVVLKDGKIDDVGTHEELIEGEGFYARLYQIQTALQEVSG